MKFPRPSPLAPLPKGERGTRNKSYSPSPLMGEGVGGEGSIFILASVLARTAKLVEQSDNHIWRYRLNPSALDYLALLAGYPP